MVEQNGNGHSEDGIGDPYKVLEPLAQRGAADVKLQAASTPSEHEMYMKFGYSMPIVHVAQMEKKLYGFLRGLNVEDDLMKVAIQGSMDLNELFMTAPCVTRKRRYREWEERVQMWQAQLDKDSGKEGGPSLNELLRIWSQADASMLEMETYEEHHGMEKAQPKYADYEKAEERREQAAMDAAELPPAANMLFWCRVEQYRIMREIHYDLAMGLEPHDFTDVLDKIAAGGDIHDLVPEMPWSFREAYLMGNRTMSSGVEYRELLVSLVAGQHAPQMPMMAPWGFPGMPGVAGTQGGQDDENEEPDKRKALFGLSFGGKRNGNQQQTNKQMRRKGRNGSNDR